MRLLIVAPNGVLLPNRVNHKMKAKTDLSGSLMFILDNDYTLSEVFKMGYSFILTRLLYPKARLIRRPFYIRGKARVTYGQGFTTGYSCRIEAFCNNRSDRRTRLQIGTNVCIGDNVHIAASEKVTIGNNCLIASKVFISDCGHGSYGGAEQSLPDSAPASRKLHTSPVHIGENVWIGENVCILAGVTIGDGAVIGSNAVVTKDIPARSIAVGIPARPIKQYDDQTKTWESMSTSADNPSS